MFFIGELWYLEQCSCMKRKVMSCVHIEQKNETETRQRGVCKEIKCIIDVKKVNYK